MAASDDETNSGQPVRAWDTVLLDVDRLACTFSPKWTCVMSGENAAVLESCARIEAALGSSAAFRCVDTQLYVVKQGSAYVLIQVIPWEKNQALVRLVAQLVRNAAMSESLAVRLLKLNARLRFGAFGYVEEGRLVTFTHTLRGGRTLDRDELLSALRDVALLADEWDNTIADLSGGETFEMVLQDELVARLQRELVDQSWQKN